MNKPHVVVIGAGAFGGWSALHLLRRGVRVTLLDAWGAGNSRASSGGDTRVIRGAYGGDVDYIGWVARSFALWKKAEARWRTPIFHRTGALWMYPGDDRHARDSIEPMRAHGLDIAACEHDDIAKRFPQFDLAGIRSIYFEPEAGYLMARRACALVTETFVQEGGTFRLADARPGRIASGAMDGLTLRDGSRLDADAFVFACGPWLGRVLPDVMGRLISPRRQEVYFFGTPAGEERFHESRLPVWLSLGEPSIYSIPGNERRGLKVADDTRGPPFDPTDGERVPTPALVGAVRAQLVARIPALAGAPLLEARVCQYEDTPDKNLIIDRHPEAANVWIVGGGSGHGFKFAPALGEHVSRLVLGDERPLPRFLLSRDFAHKGDSF